MTAAESTVRPATSVAPCDDDLVVALTLQMEELDVETECRKGKERAGDKPDRYLALEDYRDILRCLTDFYTDRAMAKSIADAVYQDAPLIEEMVAAEKIAATDREQALRIGDAVGVDAAPPPYDNGDTASILTHYDQYSMSMLPSRVFDASPDDWDDENGNTAAGPSSRPQAQALRCFSAPKIVCGVCAEQVLESTSVRCPCGDVYCSECLRRVAFNAIKDESMYPLKCCKVEVPVETLAAVLTRAECEQYTGAGVEYATANRIYCTNKKCFKFIPPDRVSDGCAVCIACETRVCVNCKGEEHPGVQCAADVGLQELLGVAGQNGWKQCSQCQRVVELLHGCNHMTCVCGAEFCYVCGVKWHRCRCELWDENMLREAAARRVDRDAEGPLPAAVRVQRIQHVQREIQENHDCAHPGKFQRRDQYRRRGYRCDICAARHWKYILTCRLHFPYLCPAVDWKEFQTSSELHQSAPPAARSTVIKPSEMEDLPDTPAVPVSEDRIWVDGCFDFSHHGHAGAMLQAKQLGRYLVVGIHSDEEITVNKGPTVMNLKERVSAVDACKWSDLSVPDAPYVTQIPWLNHFGCHYVVHGDDVTTDADGNDCYRLVKAEDRFKIVKRTPGISTTDLVGRMLLCTKQHHIKDITALLKREDDTMRRFEMYATDSSGLAPGSTVWTYDTSAPSIRRLVAGIDPQPDQRIIYVDGGFDLFSSGQIEFLRLVVDAEKQRDPAALPPYVVAGIHDDLTINKNKGLNYPIMNAVERALCVLQCRYVNAVILDAPFDPTKAFLGVVADAIGAPVSAVYHGPTSFMPSEGDPYADAKEMGIFHQVESHDFEDVNAGTIMERIVAARERFEERQRKKGVKAGYEDEMTHD
ncbi:hypothetical protein DRE_01098 [Drechslerella stenobrocha 248]|uniref:ethanolamine-phosphate cytidylyltransferase n=1 Tax=Drechslerella stenobrocha 248 TaxID=1043628 RepID=W7HW32_9PEZI|nr:hypothetical protein DRE_01098 [Drechslerella stenobrocha 248]